MQASLSARGVAAVVPQPPDHPAVSPSPSRRPSLPLLSLPNSASRTPSAAMLTATGYGSDPASCLGTPQGQVSAQGRTVGSAAGRCSIWQVLVELLMVNSSMGQATVLQHMAETRGIRLALPLQHAVSCPPHRAQTLWRPETAAFPVGLRMGLEVPVDLPPCAPARHFAAVEPATSFDACTACACLAAGVCCRWQTFCRLRWARPTLMPSASPSWRSSTCTTTSCTSPSTTTSCPPASARAQPCCAKATCR